MLTLIVPGLIWSRQALADLTHDLPLPAFATLLGRGRLRRRPPLSTATALAETTGIAAPLPSAALRRLGLGAHPRQDEWLCLDPVPLRFEERSLILGDPRQLELNADEAAALAVSLAPTFLPFGELEILAPLAWNLRLTQAAPAFQSLPEALGRSAAGLPLAPAYAAWRQALNEAQMLLHAHPVNRAREATGRPLVNSLWPWGGGRLPTPDRSAGTHDLLLSNDPIAQGIARLLQLEHATLPPRFMGAAGRVLALCDALEQPARGGDALLWREQLEALEANWLAPALAALRAGRLDAIRLLAPGDLGAAELELRRRELWRFWRKPGALTGFAPA